jgi:hypothetical protein
VISRRVSGLRGVTSILEHEDVGIIEGNPCRYDELVRNSSAGDRDGVEARTTSSLNVFEIAPEGVIPGSAVKTIGTYTTVQRIVTGAAIDMSLPPRPQIRSSPGVWYSVSSFGVPAMLGMAHLPFWQELD